MKPIWLFDLDNTLHDAAHAIFPAMHVKMNQFIAETLPEISDDATINALRIHYWARYGATLLGMMRHHDTSADHFLRVTHQFDDLPNMIRAERGLAYLLRRLSGRKILLTNAPQHYAEQVLQHLGIHRHFKRHITIESMYIHGQLRAKPSPHIFRKILKREHVTARQCILVEDTAHHLRIAKKLGFRTVWITQYATHKNPLKRHIRSPAYMDITLKSARQLMRRYASFSLR